MGSTPFDIDILKHILKYAGRLREMRQVTLSDTQQQGVATMGFKRGIAVGLCGLGGIAAAAGGLSAQYVIGRRRAERAWAAGDRPRLAGVGTVKRLTILPLIDWYTAGDDLAGEPGVSYLVRADDTTILFDVGFNVHGEHPSPLLRNMDALLGQEPGPGGPLPPPRGPPGGLDQPGAQYVLPVGATG